MIMKKIISNSELETKLIGKKFAESLKKDDVVVLSGELGAGKTKFTEGILQFFGLDGDISSPTFNIVNEYSNEYINLYHFDVYRLEDVDEFFAIGGDEYFERGICIIEWGELIKDALPKNYIEVTFSRDFDDDDKRQIIIENVVKDF